MLHSVHSILFVADQAASREFYQKVLQLAPCLDVPGMTEFELRPGCKLGLMPHAGVQRLLGECTPAGGSELYFYVDDPELYQARALAAGARLVSDLSPRNWGDRAVYLHDADGHLLVFAAQIGTES